MGTTDAHQTNNETNEQRLTGLVPRRLSPPITIPLPSDMHDAVTFALQWQGIGPYANFWEAAGAEEK